jgi:hypothetical protein
MNLTQMTTSYGRVRSQYRALRKVCRDSAEAGGNNKGVDRMTGRPLTARADWVKLEESLPALPFDTMVLTKDSHSSSERATMLAGWVSKMQKDLKDAEAALPWQTANEAAMEEKALRAKAAADGDAGYTGKWFVCHGMGRAVPKFLRFSGKVRLIS